MRNLSSKRAKALAISQKTKMAVWERDNHRCVYCHSPYALPESHFISRSKGGLGIDENILTLCRKCHQRFDFGPKTEREQMREYFRGYLKNHYPNWDEDELIYRR